MAQVKRWARPQEWVALAVALAGCRASPATELGASSTSSAPARSGGHVVLEHAAPGSVESAIVDRMAAARAAKRRFVVYVGATWCEPCQRFHKAAEHGELDATFPDLTLLEFDADADGRRLALAGYVSKYIPLFALPNGDGRASGQQIEGGVKGDSAVANIVPRLLELLAR
jgi:hypothetical protein